MRRKSRDHLSIVPLPGRGRPEAPKDLTAVEQRVWRNIVDASPDRWVDSAGQELLGLIVTQIVAAKEHAGRLRVGDGDRDRRSKRVRRHSMCGLLSA
jgi:hypothetical protein